MNGKQDSKVRAARIDPATADMMDRALKRIEKGLAPPPEIYQTQYRHKVDWSKLPDWARPSDPEVFEGTTHEG
jgi:hypothetical protein